MAKTAELSTQVIAAALAMAQSAETPDELRMAQTVLIPNLLQISDELTGQIVGRSRATVVRLRKRFREFCSGQEPQGRNWGGRRYGYLSVEHEYQFLSQYFEQASHGGVLVVSEIKKAFETLVGHKVAKTTIYRMLDRHDWGKIMPRPRHPKSNPKAREGFKKTPKDRV